MNARKQHPVEVLVIVFLKGLFLMVTVGPWAVGIATMLEWLAA